MGWGSGVLCQGARQRAVTRVASFPGEDAPGTGHRHFPERVNTKPTSRQEGFSLKSSQECYAEFPTLVRASFPLYLAGQRKIQREAAGIAAKQQPDAGPLTGHRRPPSLQEQLMPKLPSASILAEPDPQLVLDVATRKGC